MSLVHSLWMPLTEVSRSVRVPVYVLCRQPRAKAGLGGCPDLT
jgi:hypothetical protein